MEVQAFNPSTREVETGISDRWRQDLWYIQSEDLQREGGILPHSGGGLDRGKKSLVAAAVLL